MSEDPRKRKKPECLMCGHCCGPYFALYVEEGDEKRWHEQGRQDILDRLQFERDRVRWNEQWPYDAVTGEVFEKCHYLIRLPDGRAVCSIHNTKPDICRDYPAGSSEICILHRKRKIAFSEA